MSIRMVIPLLCLTAFFPSCSGILPSVGILAPDSVVGHEMNASGLEGSYHFEFMEDGTYQRVQTFPSGKRSNVTKGTWQWQRDSPKNAILTLDDDMEVSLHFTTREHANASIPNNPRLFPVEFTDPGGQSDSTGERN